MGTGISIVMFGWIAVVLAMFAFLPHRRAAIAAFLIGWMFLPIAEYPIHGFPDYTKLLATCMAPLLAAMIFDFRRLISFRPCWADAPMLFFCLSPFASSLQNGLGIHDGLSVVFSQIVSWGAPYAIGRLYIDDLAAMQELASGIVISAAIYSPLCWFELWRGPGLHKLVYGFGQQSIDKSTHLGILRPLVFMDDAIMMALWMATAAVVAFWLWRSRALPSVLGVPMGWLAPVLIATALLLRSVSGWIALLLGVALLLAVSRWRTTAPVICVLVVIPCYIMVRATGLWSGDQAVYTVSKLINDEKRRSIEFRFLNEDAISANARQRPILGWGRQAAVLSTDKFSYFGLNYAIPDSLWIILFASYGVLGLLGFLGSMLSPVTLFLRRFPAEQWMDARTGPVAAVAVLVVLFMTDRLANAMHNPCFVLSAGGLCTVSLTAVRKTAMIAVNDFPPAITSG